MRYTTHAAGQKAKSLREIADMDGVVPASEAADLAADLAESLRRIDAMSYELTRIARIALAITGDDQ